VLLSKGRNEFAQVGKSNNQRLACAYNPYANVFGVVERLEMPTCPRQGGKQESRKPETFDVCETE
jgi:hypothetical protein